MPVTDNAAVRAQLGKILASPVFVKSPRMSRFLRFVVESTLAGEGAKIKEYVIAVEVFDKPETYDPQADSTVRSEASKLRSRLGRYYAGEGVEDPVVISIPKGSYVPTFEARQNGDAAASGTARLRWLRPAASTVAGVAIIAAAILWISGPAPRARPRLVPLTSYPELEEQPSLSPDGSRVAFCWKGDIYVKQVEGEAVVQVTKDAAGEAWPAWSPDGDRIAFVRRGEVFLVSPLGGAERKVAESAGRVAWNADGSAIFVLGKTSPYASSIFLVSLASGEKRRLTFPDDMSPGDTDMAISPDGRMMAFCRHIQTEGCELFAVPVSGGEPHRLTNDRRFILGLAWTPNGREIVFSSNRQGSFRLWRVPARPERRGAFDDPKLLEVASDDARYPSISRTARVAYQRYTRNFDIRRAEITGREGATTHRLRAPAPLIASTRLDVTPAWSPDGRKIAFVSDRSGDREVWVCEADGSNPLMLTSFAGPAVIYPRWSPDGRRIIFNALTGPGGNFETYIIAAAGGAPQRVSAVGHRSMAHPVFSHDGRWVYFIPGPQEGAVEAWRMPAAGGAAVQITSHGAFRPEESPDGKLLYYGRYGVRGLWSTPVAGGEERQVVESVTGTNWTVTPKGIYYFDFGVARDAPKAVKFYSFETGGINLVGTVEPTVSNDFAGISVSPDGRWLLYSHIANSTSDLMLVDHVLW